MIGQSKSSITKTYNRILTSGDISNCKIQLQKTSSNLKKFAAMAVWKTIRIVKKNFFHRTANHKLSVRTRRDRENFYPDKLALIWNQVDRPMVNMITEHA